MRVDHDDAGGIGYTMFGATLEVLLEYLLWISFKRHLRDNNLSLPCNHLLPNNS